MEINLKNLQKKAIIPRTRIFKAAKAAVREIGKKKAVRRGFSSLSIVFVGAVRMRGINRKFLGHDYATDVLTFDLGEGQAEIIICPQVAAVNAREHRTTTQQEILLYVIHGILHLSGFDDHGHRERLKMREMENYLLGMPGPG